MRKWHGVKKTPWLLVLSDVQSYATCM